MVCTVVRWYAWCRLYENEWSRGYGGSILVYRLDGGTVVLVVGPDDGTSNDVAQMRYGGNMVGMRECLRDGSDGGILMVVVVMVE